VARKKKSGGKATFLLICLAVIAGAGLWFKTQLDGNTAGKAENMIFTSSRGLSSVLNEFESKGIIKSAFAAKVLSVLSGTKRTINPGVYRVSQGMSAQDALTSLRNPIKQLVRIPEERWISRVAKLLEEKKVAKADEYIVLSKHPEKFSDSGIPFFNDSLEGFLYPDTYNFAPDIGADYVIKRQLMNFEKRTAGLGLTKENMRRTIIIASLLELEASDYKEKQMIAGVIENRLMHGMRLQIDATINYAIQEWRPLVYKDYTNVKSPYNTYLAKGLPPGPICSPTAKSIEAALHPIKHKFVYYITMPDKVTRFSATYPEHLVNVKLRDTMKAQQQ
jgi:UPF0755 protein